MDVLVDLERPDLPMIPRLLHDGQFRR